jgi:hypothetical protein
MSLADDVRALRDQALEDLNAAHDYYTDTKTAWDIVRQFIAAGRTFSIQNTTTGTVTTQAELGVRARGYVAEQLAEATFQHFISIFENYFFSLLRLWLVAHPQNLIGKKVDFKAVLEAPDKDALVVLAVNKELNEILYERPTSWFTYLNEKVKTGCPTQNEIDRIAEAKASRDVLAHNRGVASKSYELKAGTLARYKDGEQIDIPEDYHRQIWELLRKVVADISNAMVVKAR